MTSGPYKNPAAETQMTEEMQLQNFVGMQIRERRRFLGMTIADLSTSTGISLSHLSKIETAQVAPSLSVLDQIATSLGVPVAWLFKGYKDEGFVIKVSKGQGLITERSIKSGGHTYELLSNSTGQVHSFQAFLVTLDEVGPQRAAFSNRATEFIFVVSGTFAFRYGTRILSLSSGDSLIFDGRISHGPEKVIEGTVQYLAVLVRLPDDTL